MSKLFGYRPKNQNKQSGQGLVEYALILVLVAIVAVLVLALLGPAIGNVFSSVLGSMTISGGSGGSGPTPTATAPAPTPTPTPAAWTLCAAEGGTCNIGAGSHPVRYGKNGTYFTQTFSGPTGVGCNNGVFGDPVPGTVKECDYQ